MTKCQGDDGTIDLHTQHVVSQKMAPLDFQSKQQIFTAANKEIVSTTITITRDQYSIIVHV